MTWDRVESLMGKDNLQKLAGKKIGVIGVGSGGGFVAQSLAMSGVGQFVLVDDDVLEETNIVRHVADRRDLGHHKAEAVAQLIHQRNPVAKVDIRVGRIEQHMDVLDDLDLLIVGVDGEQSKYIINEACLARNLSAVYAGVYERGEGGDVVIIHPYNGPCYACWAATLREGMGNDAQDLDYGMIGPEGTLEAEPGLWLHVVRIAATQADFAIKELLNDTELYPELPGNTVILANNAIEIIDGEITPPHSAVWVHIERDTECLICGDKIRARSTDEHQGLNETSLADLAGELGIDVEEDEDDAQQVDGK
jgi:molybdopterin/thiamine biosynthesis adenylyltransferase